MQVEILSDYTELSFSLSLMGFYFVVVGDTTLKPFYGSCRCTKNVYSSGVRIGVLYSYGLLDIDFSLIPDFFLMKNFDNF